MNICNSSIQEQMAENTDVSYFSEDQGGFTTVDENTSFYLDEDGSVVVVFPEGALFFLLLRAESCTVGEKYAEQKGRRNTHVRRFGSAGSARLPRARGRV